MEELVGAMTGAVTQGEAAQQAVLDENATETQS